MTGGAVSLNRWAAVAVLGSHDTDPVVDAIPQTEPAVPLDTLFGQPMGLAACVGADHHLSHQATVIVPVVLDGVTLWQCVDRSTEDLDMIDSGVRSRVARSDDLGQDLAAFNINRQ